MPHVTVHIVPGHSEEEKQRLAQKLHQTMKQELNMDGSLISVAIREVDAENWTAFIHTVPDFYVYPEYLKND